MLNQCGTLLTRKRHKIKGSSKHKLFLQKICATTIASSIPLMYHEAVLFPYIHLEIVDNSRSILGVIPASYLTKSISRYGFSPNHKHVRYMLTSSSVATRLILDTSLIAIKS